MSSELAIDNTLQVVRHELVRALARFGPYASPHEGIAVVREEYLELEREVFWSDGRAPAAINEAVQLSAVAARYVLELDGRR